MSARIAIAALAIQAFGLQACSSSRRTIVDSASVGSTTVTSSQPGGAGTTMAAAPSDTAVPTSVDEVGTHGEDLYDAVSGGRWSGARAIADSLRRAARRIPNDGRIAPYRVQLAALLDTLDRAVSARRRATALEGANRVTFLSAKMTDPFRPATPTGVLLLDYYGREVDIWAARRDTARLRRTVADLRGTWNALRPDIIARGGSAQAGRTDSLVARMEHASSFAAYARAATPFLDEVDELEKIYTRQ